MAREKSTVIGVVGLPYCGSTLLSYLLGAHSRVYNGADLYKLNANHAGDCSIHHESCEVWTRDNLEYAYRAYDAGAKWYAAVREITGAEVIVDASKAVPYFERRLKGREVEFRFVSLRKHPLRHVVSLLHNHLFVKTFKISTAEEIERVKLNEWNAIFDFIREKIAQLELHYSECLEFAKRTEQPVLELKYEECVEDPVAAIAPILEFCDLEPEAGIEDYAAFEHHPIVGNSGPHIRVQRASAEGAAMSEGLRKSFYAESSSDIVLDEKYRMIFSTNEIDFLYRHTRLGDLCKRLSYATLGGSADLREGQV